ncbi:hypothetical protein [Roseovarius indicus]|uniref:DUF1127 domain-containing protein n=1 Tax=Roseovarius indicus TaxID=540747 RepID=A0A0T5PDF5_9RHOB|nr:hypothetical protein [Roseovarius indicus]KRS19200.1 hypothetical protein XM52_05965 [Roseovarius indicus]QEW25836.1 hypothetical protein RIdsm_01625 [Roseovarius indicus]SFD89082.1 hypothetical protein SAMN04488031_10338 [Roseovarius indicus]
MTSSEHFDVPLPAALPRRSKLATLFKAVKGLIGIRRRLDRLSDMPDDLITDIGPTRSDRYGKRAPRGLHSLRIAEGVRPLGDLR